MDTFPNISWPSDASVQALNGTMDSKTGMNYISNGTSPSSSPSLAVQVDRLQQRLNQILETSNQLRFVSENSGLLFGIYPGDYRFSDGTFKHFNGATAQTLNNNDTNSIYINSSNVLVISITGFPADITTFVPIASVVTASGVITTLTDLRGRIKATIPANTTTSSTGTNDVSFILDEDNVSAQVDTQLRFNRGSSDAEDASVMWDSANNRIELRTQHSSGTLSDLNINAVYINGISILDSTGASKVRSGVAGSGLTETVGVLSVNTGSSSGTQINGGIVSVDPSDGIAIDTNGVAVAFTANDGLEFSTGSAGSRTLQLKPDNLTVEVDSANGLQLKDTGTDATKFANISANGTGAVIFMAQLTNGNTITIHNANAPFKYQVIDAWSIALGTKGGTWQIRAGLNAISDVVTVSTTDQTMNRISKLDDNTFTILLSGTLKIVGDGSLATCMVYVMAIPVV